MEIADFTRLGGGVGSIRNDLKIIKKWIVDILR